MNVSIANIMDHPHFIPTAKQWWLNEWGFDSYFDSMEPNDKMPQVFCAIVDGQIVGTAVLAEKDLPGYEQLTPWMACVYILPRFRGQGISKLLIQSVIEAAVIGGYNSLWLFTESASTLYSKFGWEVHCVDTYKDKPILIMNLKLNCT